MIQTPQGVDRGRALFKQFPQAITNYVVDRKTSYFKSKGYAGLRNRCRLNDDMIDGIYKTTQSFISDVSPPIIRKAYKEFNAIFNKFLENDPLYSVDENEGIPHEKAEAIQAKTGDGIKKSEFRKKALPWIIDSAVRYGTFTAYSFATSDENANALITVPDESGSGDYKQVYGEEKNVVVTTAIHPLNTIVDPRSNWIVPPSFKGFIGDISIAALSLLKDNENDIQENLTEVIDFCKNGLTDKDWFGGSGSAEVKDYSRGHTQITYLWTMLPFAGNEDDPFWYCIEFVEDKIIRIEVNTLDLNTIPLATGCVIPRPYTWSGNTPLEDKISIQNMQNWLINTEFMITAKLMDKIRLYREGEIDVVALNSRHITGGMVGYKGQEPDLSRLIYDVPNQDASRGNMQWLVEEMRQQDQETSPLPNLDNRFGTTPGNKTLGGANMSAGIGEMLTGEYINKICQGLSDVAKQRLMIERAIAPDQVDIGGGKMVPKEMILGPVNFTVKMSNFYNFAKALTDSSSALNSVINWRATKLPEAQGFKLQAYFKQWARAAAKRENVSEYFDEKLVEKALQAQQNASAPPDKPTVSIAYKDLPPDAQVQLLAQIGIKIQPPAPPMMPGQPGASGLPPPQQGGSIPQPTPQGGMNVR